ncbi:MULTISPECIES: nuclear transport factor 2 family protein [unclassified Arthrobacter]|uniref:nuclear transport factor 2 family protein n=1 Tax=unclassified Arthrobacter TaxID=235627 RepID=UPI001F47D569|nr:nuclear transport factor 2 family protein [Arthrobacter sp. FW306-06-A]UKA71023.1 nuclear transport factor 2 family protein [Arthrobacter sp. FW306-06-A]
MTQPASASEHVHAWMERYQAAWTSNAADDIGALFTPDAVDETRPHDPEAWRGRDGIVDGWLAARDEPGGWTFTWELLGCDGATAFVQGVTVYSGGGPTYDNLWVIRFTESGRAASFTEWFMARS